MVSFIDETRLELYSGDGGNGSISFRREKYIDRGGPDGGDGGYGGDVVFKVQKNLKTFTHFQNRHKFLAANGGNGGKSKCSGANAEPLIMLVPPGSRILDYETREVLLDLGEDEIEHVFLKGGRGGKGNWQFRTSRNQAPEYATKGRKGVYREVLLELSIIADIGFVGLPNAGKSSLLRAITTANPKVAPYPFTTKIPNLGIIHLYDDTLILADIPGIIEGAHLGSGLGLRFLKHIRRTKALAFLVDISNEFTGVFEQLLNELNEYDTELASKKRILIATKLDEEVAKENLAKFKESYPNEHVVSISTFSRDGLEDLIKEFWRLKEE